MQPDQPVGASHPRRWLILPVLCMAVLVVNVDSTILNVALPTLVRKLHATSSDLQWIVDAYAMTFGGLLLVSGSLADHLGRKRLFLSGFGVFALASFGAAFSDSVTSLIAWRAVMGAGAALTIPAGLSILNDVFRDPQQRARAIGAWSGTIGVGLAIGPLAGGLLLSRFWWGSVFFVNVPVAVIGGLLAWRFAPESKDPGADAPDPAGALLSMLGFGLVLWAIIEAPLRGWTSTSVVVVGITGLVALAAFFAWEARSGHPMLKLAFFRSRRFSAAITALALGLFALFGAVFVLTQVLQNDLGFSPLQAGVRILPIAGVLALAAPASTLLVRAVGSKVTATAGLLAIAGGLWQISAASTVSASYSSLLPGMLALGVGAGLLMPTCADSVLGSVPRERAGVGSATYGTSIQVGGAFGVAVIGSLLSTRYVHRITAALASQHVPAAILHEITGSLGGALGVAAHIGPPSGPLLVNAARTAFMSGSHVSIGAGALVAAGAALVVLLTLPSRASEV
ncbi:MAG: DHA2 family efflux MFS transporter permease subunit [Solirubrobacteraceae bacterium]|jgi:EmrB/QacA subfamily drug resistance transporter